MNYIWVVRISGRPDDAYFSTAEKAYGYLIDEISAKVIDANEASNRREIVYYSEQVLNLDAEFYKDEEDFGCAYGYATKMEVD